ncbi:putative solute carrier family 35 member B1 [Operophtera brumata]|uniref:Putative solute carrier family 35 member B1 n=1 Tax=Operophtera brumata TaxID=104452 RepID=A0A0L7LMU6_OPEBR|nr:putative solute carrier family 35 member B1 [Operophtera brumata]
MTKNRSELRFIFYSAGIFVCYFVFGMLQEKITRGKYGNNDKFTCALSLVLIQCVANYIFAQILMLSWKHEKDTTKRIYYFSSAMTYLLAMVCSIMALQWVNYPTQTYPLRKYLFVFLIVVGVALFMYKDHGKQAGEASSVIIAVGAVLSGDLVSFVAFASLYPQVIVYVVGLALTGALGQLFIFYMVRLHSNQARVDLGC